MAVGQAFFGVFRGWDADRAAYVGLLGAVFGITFSTSIGQGLAGFAIAAWVWALVRGRTRFAPPPAGWPAAAFVLLAVVSCAAHAGWSGFWKCGGKLGWFVFLPIAAALVTSPARGRGVLRAYALGCGVLGALTVVGLPVTAARRLAAGTPPGFSYLDHVFTLGSMTDGQLLMMGVVATLLLAVAARREGGRVWPWLALLALEGLALGLNFKRGSWAVTVLVVVALACALRRWKVLAALGLLLAAALCLPPVRARLGQAAGELNVNGGGRLTMWFRVAPALVREHPWGIGYGGMTEERMQQVAPNVEKHRNHLHSNPAEVLVETGWPGLALYLVWMTAGVVAAARAWRRARALGPAEGIHALAALALLAGLLLNGLVEYNFGDSELMLLYGVLMGLPAAWRAGGPRPAGA